MLIIKRKGRILLAGLGLWLSLSGDAFAQSTSDSIRNQLLAINRVYDSAFYLSFDIKMIYETVPLPGGSPQPGESREEITGNYILNGKKALYKLGDIQYLRNDSFRIAVYSSEKIMLVEKPDTANSNSQLMPTRTIIDSLLNQMDNNYQYSLSMSDTLNQISFIAADSNQQLEALIIQYEPVTFYLLRVSYRFKDYNMYVEDGPFDQINSANSYLPATMSFYFNNYGSSQIGASVFNESVYIFREGPGIFRPADLYRDYTLYKNY